MSSESRVIAALVPAIVLLAPTGSLAVPPANDDFLNATPLNAPGSRMPRDTITSPLTETAEAGLQGDLLLPPSSGGPPEPAQCGTAALDRTVWFRFFPDVSGRIILQAVGFDATLALVPFTSVSEPLPQGYTCANARDDSIESLRSPVEAGAAYAVQVGGAGGAAGRLQVSFTFQPDRDQDGLGDEQDECPHTPGTESGCPPRIGAAFPFRYDDAAGGVRLRYLEVREAPVGARIDVRCNHGCRHQRVTVRSRVVRLAGLRSRYLRRGTRIEVRVTKARYIGAYRRFDVGDGGIKTTMRCLPPGSIRPRRSCDESE